MRVLIFTDNHFKEHASIINMYGTNYSLRIENQLKSIQWLQFIAKSRNCSEIICAGDFFDKPELNENEITALQEICWEFSDFQPEYHFLVGNHESSTIDLSTSSTKILEGPRRIIEDKPKIYTYGNTEICYLPYITERERKPLEAYFGRKPLDKKRIIISHNDIAGIQMGVITSSTGFSIDEFEANADLVVNGHLHNGYKVSDKVINLGDLTGKDFGEDATKYLHRIMIIDTDTLDYEFIENPYAFNFYKLDCFKDIDLSKIYTIKDNAVLSIKCDETLLSEVNNALKENDYKIIKSRVIPVKVVQKSDEIQEIDISDLTVDVLPKLIECVHEKLGTSDLINSELTEICK